MQAPANKRRRNYLISAACVTVFAAFQVYFAYSAQMSHTVIWYKSGWYTPEAAYLAAVCFFAIAAYFIVSAFRRANDRSQSDHHS
jgi:TRAP-type C4-dicarboxylate transport system permease small subunit